MKLNKYIPLILAGVAGATVASAQIPFTITGATAFRSITIDRGLSMFDAGTAYYTNGSASLGTITALGTMSNAVSALGANQVEMRMYYSGSIEGMNDLKNLALVPCAKVGGGTTNSLPDVAFSDVFPASANPPIAASTFNDFKVGVVPMIYVKNNGILGMTDLTQDKAVFFMVNNGPGIPQSYFGGSSAADIYLIGRDSGSGTRATVEKCVKFVGAPTLWATNTAGAYVSTNGYLSGGLVKNVVTGKSDAVGYHSLGDYTGSYTNAATILSYNGVPYTITNVYKGNYTIWGYEHMLNRTGVNGLNANQLLIFNALKARITDATYQATSSNYKGKFGELNAMEVERNGDGGPLSSLLF